MSDDHNWICPVCGLDNCLEVSFSRAGSWCRHTGDTTGNDLVDVCISPACPTPTEGEGA